MGAEGPLPGFWRFEGFTLDLGRGALLGPDGAEVPLRPKSFALLRLLVENAGRLLDRDAILEAIWPDVVVTEQSITQCIHDIRTALGDEAQRVVKTVLKRGYLFEALVSATTLTPEPGMVSRAFLATEAASPRQPAAHSGAERRQLTVLACDLVGSTVLSEQLDLEDFGEVIHAYQDRCTAAIVRFGGTVDSFMGDGVLAYFGYPNGCEDAAERAVRAGLAIAAAIDVLRPCPAVTLQVRVGIATGHVRVGPTEGVQGDVAIGKPQILARRLQVVAEPGAVVVADGTRCLVGGMFAFEDLGCHSLPGFAAPVRASRVTGPSTAGSRFEALHGASATPLVGRGHELSLLLDRWEQAREGEGQVILLAGEPGIGKSRLVQALRDRIAGEDHADLGYQCSPHHQDSSLQPVIAHLERAAKFTDGDGPEGKLAKLESFLAQGTADIAWIGPLFASLLSIPADGRYPPLDLSPRLQRERTLAALVDRYAELAAHRPVLLIWEDAHWADPTSLELLGLVIHRLQKLPVLAVVTFRPEFAPPWPSHTHATWLMLSRLSRKRCLEVVAGLTGGRPLPAPVLDQILARAEGIPLFVEELTKAVLESRLLKAVGESHKAGDLLPPLAIPASLEDSLIARLDRLGSAKEVAQVAAVIGREFSQRLIAAMASLTDVELDVALDHLVRAELVFRQGEPPQATYSFKHALVRDAAYATLLRAKRRELHGRVADVLESSLPELVEAHPELLARHHTEAGRLEAAIPAWILAGQRALARLALTEAETLLRKGLALLSGMPNGTWRRQRELELQIALGRALMAIQGHAAPATGRAYARARELCEQLNRPPLLVPVLFGQCVHHLMRAELELSRAHAAEMQRLGEEQDDVRLRLMGCRLAGQPEIGLGQFTAARAHLEHGLALFDPSHRPFYTSLALQDARVMLLSFLAQALLCLGHPDQARERWEEAIAEARQLKHAYSLAVALCFASMLAVALAMVGEGAGGVRSTALPLVEEFTTLSSEQGFAMLHATGTLYRGWCLTAEGLVTEGLALLDRSLTAYRGTGCILWEPFFLVLLADAHARAHRPKDGLGYLAEATRTMEATQERWAAAEVYRLEGELRTQLGQQAAAEACFRRALTMAGRQDAKLWELRTVTSLARFWHEHGRKADARHLLAPVYDWFTEGFDTPDIKNAKALLAELCA